MGFVFRHDGTGHPTGGVITSTVSLRSAGVTGRSVGVSPRASVFPKDQARGNSSAGQENAIGPTVMVAAGIVVDLRKLKNIQSILLRLDPPVRPGLRRRSACLRLLLLDDRFREHSERDGTMGKGDRRSQTRQAVSGHVRQAAGTGIEPEKEEHATWRSGSLRRLCVSRLAEGLQGQESSGWCGPEPVKSFMLAEERSAGGSLCLAVAHRAL